MSWLSVNPLLVFLENAKFNFREVGFALKVTLTPTKVTIQIKILSWFCKGLPNTSLSIWFYIQELILMFLVFLQILKRLNFNLPGSWLSAGVSHFSIIRKHFPKKSKFWQNSWEFCNKLPYIIFFAISAPINCSLYDKLSPFCFCDFLDENHIPQCCPPSKFSFAIRGLQLFNICMAPFMKLSALQWEMSRNTQIHFKHIGPGRTSCNDFSINFF